MSDVKDRMLKFIAYKGIKTKRFEEMCGMSNGYVGSMRKGLGQEKLSNVLKSFPELNRDWLLYGEGEMLNGSPAGLPSSSESKLIPFFDDVYTVGGDGEIRACVDGQGYCAEMVNTGDWFKSATAAIRHVGDSMAEYPSGSILAVRRVDDLGLLINGKSYVIETTEYRVTKIIRDEGDFLMAYSTNTERYPDGSLVYAPMKIPKKSIRHIDIVLGCVNIEQGTLIDISRK